MKVTSTIEIIEVDNGWLITGRSNVSSRMFTFVAKNIEDLKILVEQGVMSLRSE